MQEGGTSDKTCNKKLGLCAVTSLPLSPLHYAVVLGSVLGQSAHCLPYPELPKLCVMWVFDSGCHRDLHCVNTHHRKAELQCGIYSTLSTRCVGCICYSDNVWSDRLQGETWSSLHRECPLVQHSTIQLDSQHRSHCAYCTQH